MQLISMCSRCLYAENIALTEPGRIDDEIDTVCDLLQRSDKPSFERDTELLPLTLEVLTELWGVDREGVVRDANRAGRAVGRVQVSVLVCGKCKRERSDLHPVTRRAHVWNNVLVPVPEQIGLVLGESSGPLEPHCETLRHEVDPLLAAYTSGERM